MGIAVALSVVAAARGGGSIGPDRVRPLVSRGVVELVAGALGPLAGDSAADVHAFRAALAEVSADPGVIFPGVVSALEQFGGMGMPMAVVTNKPEHLARRLLRDLGLTAYFQAIVGGDTLAIAKPDPAPLRHALAAIGGHSCEALMIGDSAVDAQAAAAAGLPFVLYEGGYGAGECAGHDVAHRFSSFEALIEVIERSSKTRAA